MDEVAGIEPLEEMMGDAFVDIVDAIAAADRTIAGIMAVRAELVDEARQWSEMHAAGRPGSATNRWTPERVARRELVTELACALRIPERAAENLIEQSRSLAHELPVTMASLQRGEISLRHAQVVIDQANSLPEEVRAAFDAKAAPFARNLTVSRFTAKARVLRERMHPDSIDTRVAKCVEDRELFLEPARDGMAYLTAFLPAVDAHAIYNRVTDIAAGLRGPDETRTLTQLRVDTFRDLLVDGVTDDAYGFGSNRIGNGIVARVLITVPALTLLDRQLDGCPAGPAMLEGYGPIDAETARMLTADAPSLTRLLTHPETGAVLSVGRDSYAVPKDLRTWLRVRDGTCRYPGCGQPARRCDIDHTDDWQYGANTAHDNLAHLCPKHHQTKHHTRWDVEQIGDGILEWHSPSGRIYRTEPDTYIGRMGDSAA